MLPRKLVAVVDDDESVRESLPDLLRSFGLEVEPFASAEAFLASGSVERTGCLVLDVAMPGISGPELLQELVRRNQAPPIVFITAYADDRVRTTAFKHGAVAYLTKPFSEDAILGAVNAALGGR
jgi:FixJ family two-component response regulator